METEQIQEKSKLTIFLKKNWLILVIFLIAFSVRFYYFTLTINQPLWWDEASYMSEAKAYAGIIQGYDIGSHRLPGFPLLMSIFFILGIANEAIMRFFGLLIPSLIVILLAYFMAKEMYDDKRIAAISALIIAVLWEHLFYSNRFHTENFALIFEFLAIFVLFSCYLKGKDLGFIKSKYSLLWIILMAAVSFLFRPGNLVFAPALFLFVLIASRKKIFTKKGIIAISLIIAAIILSFFISETPGTLLRQYAHMDSPIAWNVLPVFYGFYQSTVPIIPSVFLYAFFIGAAIALVKTILLIDKIKILDKDSENLEFKSDFFNILLLASTILIFMLVVRPYQGFEYRWFFPMLPAMLAFTGKGIIDFSEYAGKLLKEKNIAAVLIILIVSVGMFTQIAHADSIIKDKLDSYSQVRDAALWMKENSDKTDVILSISHPQTFYYSERKVISYSEMNETSFQNFIDENNPRFLEVSAFESHPEWISGWIEKNNETLDPVKAYFSDSKKTKLLLVVYEFKYA